jgi:hypothetical protein
VQPNQQAFQRLAPILQDMPPVRDLNRMGSAFGRPTGVVDGAIPRNDFHTRVGFQPGRQDLRRPLANDIDRSMGFIVDQERAVDPALA